MLRTTSLILVLLTLFAAAACRKDEQPAAEAPSQQPASSTATSAPPAVAGTEVGSMMPAYSAVMLDGSPFDLQAKKGKVVLLNLWATWCGPCRYEIPELQALHDEHQARGFEVIGVSVDEGAPQLVKDFAAEQKMTYPIVLDPAGKLATILDTSVLPTTLVIDRDGKIVWKKFGVVTGDDPELQQALSNAL